MLPVYSNTQITEYLAYGYWRDMGKKWHAFSDTTITYNIQGLTSAAQTLAVKALDTWSATTGLTFVAVTGSAQITFDDNKAGAGTNVSYIGNTTQQASVNIGTDWLATYGTSINGYSFQTYIHEIGHALGLGHGGNYNNSANYSEEPGAHNHYVNDSWQASIMSYFDQDENTYVDATKAYVIGPMVADIQAIRYLYGFTGLLNRDDTTYGFNSTAEGYFDFSLFSEYNMVAFTIQDTDGIDTFDASGFTSDQYINLAQGSYSNIGGEIGNIGIGIGAVIERAIGGSGDDQIYANDEGADSDLFGNDGSDSLISYAGIDTLNGGAGDDYLDGGSGGDTFIGGDGSDIFVIENQADTVSDTSGFDTILAQVNYSLQRGVRVELLEAQDAFGFSGVKLIGNEFSQMINGTAGDDVLSSGGGNDTIKGYAGADTLTGSTGNDTFDGGLGADKMTGGAGHDTYITDGTDTITELANAGIDLVKSSATLTLGANLENLTLTGTSNIGGTGNTLANTITGNDGVNILIGGGGSDQMVGGLGNDTYIVDGGDNVVETSAAGGGLDTVKSSASITLNANIENLILTGSGNIFGVGNTSNNAIVGNGGNNVLTGYGGADQFSGGLGADTFMFRTLGDSTVATTGRDLIRDFSHAQGDRINLSLIDANTTTAATNDAFTFIGADAFSGAAGELRAVFAGANTLVSGDVDGNGTADFAILLQGKVTLDRGDFLL